MRNFTADRERIRRVFAPVERVFPFVVPGAAAVGISLLLRTQWPAIQSFDWTVSPRAVALSVVAFAVAPLTQGVSFWLVLRLLTGKTSLLDGLLVWSRSYVIRYAPTGALAIAYRVHARHRLHASADQVLAAYAYEHIGSLAAGAAVCLGLFAALGDRPPLLPLGIAVATLVVTAAVRPGIAGRAVQAIAGRLGLHLSLMVSGAQLAAVIAVNAVGWLGTGTAVYVLVTALSGDGPGFTWLIASYTAGYLVGFVTPLAPGGMGAREGTLVVLLGARYGTGVATAIALGIRVANAAGELLAVGLVHVAYSARLAWERHGRRADVATVATPSAP